VDALDRRGNHIGGGVLVVERVCNIMLNKWQSNIKELSLQKNLLLLRGWEFYLRD
jgi:hypothetical protein